MVTKHGRTRYSKNELICGQAAERFKNPSYACYGSHVLRRNRQRDSEKDDLSTVYASENPNGLIEKFIVREISVLFLRYWTYSTSEGQRPFKALVVGSSPTQPTFFLEWHGSTFFEAPVVGTILVRLRILIDGSRNINGASPLHLSIWSAIRTRRCQRNA